MTEKEAKLKWCPMVRMLKAGVGNSTSINRTGNGAKANGTTCIASKCMMWTVTTKVGGGLREDSGVCGLTGSRN